MLQQKEHRNNVLILLPMFTAEVTLVLTRNTGTISVQEFQDRVQEKRKLQRQSQISAENLFELFSGVLTNINIKETAQDQGKNLQRVRGNSM